MFRESYFEAPIDDPVLLQTEVRRGLEWLCKACWQNASAVRQSKYSRFAMTREMFQKERLRWDHAYRQPMTLNQIREVIWNIICSDDPGFSYYLEQEQAGRALKLFSEILCILGGRASFGDLEMHMRCLQRDWTPTPDLPVAPVEALRSFRRENVGPIAIILQHRLCNSVAQVTKLSYERNVLATDLRVLALSSQGQYWVDYEFVDTSYLYDLSLLEFVAPSKLSH